MIHMLINFALVLLLTLINDGGNFVFCGNETQSAQQNLTDGKQEIALNSMVRKEYKKTLSSQNNKASTGENIMNNFYQYPKNFISLKFVISSDFDEIL